MLGKDRMIDVMAAAGLKVNVMDIDGYMLSPFHVAILVLASIGSSDKVHL